MNLKIRQTQICMRLITRAEIDGLYLNSMPAPARVIVDGVSFRQIAGAAQYSKYSQRIINTFEIEIWRKLKLRD